jgi:hypothetical protein
VAVRVNGLDTPWALRDIADIARQAPRLDLVLLPKTSCAGDVRFVDRLLTLVERETGRDKRVGIEVLIETRARRRQRGGDRAGIGPAGSDDLRRRATTASTCARRTACSAGPARTMRC